MGRSLGVLGGRGEGLRGTNKGSENNRTEKYLLDMVISK